MISGLLATMWFFLGIIFAIAKRDIAIVAVCFMTYGILQGSCELYMLRKELEKTEDKGDE